MEITETDMAIEQIKNEIHSYGVLHDKLISYLNRDPLLKDLVHSYKSRFKDFEHLKEKVERKNRETALLEDGVQKELITADNIKSKVTDICGIRILHLHVSQFKEIHRILMGYVSSDELALFEKPKAYTWDPEYADYFKKLEVDTHLKESF